MNLETLTPQQRVVAGMLARGMTNREITEKLVIANHTIDAHIVNIRERLGFKSSRQLIVALARDAAMSELTDAMEAISGFRSEAG